MKKVISVFLIIAVVMFCIVGCKNSSLKETVTQNTVIQDIPLSTNVKNTEKATGTDIGGGEIVQEKYRQCYYNITYQLSLLVDKDELRSWEKEVLSKDPNDINEMVVKLFVQHFNISKEDFEKANLELAKVLYDPNSPPPSMNPKDYINQEMFEIYNADIIYTFNDDIINEYYLSGDYPFVYESDYEEALLNGEYTSRTTDWIDIEQMEAEIIAKYGEAEIVTTVTNENITTVTETETLTETITETTTE